MPEITKVLTVRITPEQFLENCSDIELKELDLLIQSPRYVNRVNDNKQIGFNQDKQGFDTIEEFFAYFNEDFVGKIIHWTDLRY